MSSIAHDIFRLTGSGQSGGAAYKPTARPPATQQPADAGDIDKVTLSQLAQSLKAQGAASGGKALSGIFEGETAKLFGGLDKQSQETLQGLFDSGAVSARDVELGLQAGANTALSFRAAAERPRSAAELAEGQEAADLRALSREYANATRVARNVGTEAQREFDQGQIGEEELQAAQADSARQMASLEADKKYENIHERANAAFEVSVNRSTKGLANSLGGKALTDEQLTAQQKLAQLGFGGPADKEAFRDYARQAGSLTPLR